MVTTLYFKNFFAFILISSIFNMDRDLNVAAQLDELFQRTHSSNQNMMHCL